MKKILGTLILLAAGSVIACSGAPVGSGEPTASGSEPAAKQETAPAGEAKSESKNPEIFRSCSQAQIDACIRANDGWPCNCELVNGRPECIYCQ
jgi:hypothetical protein